MTAEQCVSHFRAVAAKAERAMLVIAFPNETKPLSAALPDSELLKQVIALLGRGGDPVGVIRFVQNPSGLGIETLLMPEHANDPIARQLLRDIVNHMADAAERQLGITVERPQGDFGVRRPPPQKG